MRTWQSRAQPRTFQLWSIFVVSSSRAVSVNGVSSVSIMNRRSPLNVGTSLNLACLTVKQDSTMMLRAILGTVGGAAILAPTLILGENQKSATAPKIVAEKITGAEFPVTMQNPVCPTEKQVLIGAGLRCMLQACNWTRARAYAVGLYIPSSFSSGSKEDTGAQVLASVAADRQISKTVRLVFSGDSNGKHVAQVFFFEKKWDFSIKRCFFFGGIKQKGF